MILQVFLSLCFTSAIWVAFPIAVAAETTSATANSSLKADCSKVFQISPQRIRETEYSLEDLIYAAQLLQLQPNTRLVTPDLKRELALLLDVDISSLTTPENLKHLLGLLYKAEPERYKDSVGLLLQEVRSNALNQTADDDRNSRYSNLQNFWGWRVLADDDPAFNDPTYLLNYMKLAHATGTGHYQNERHIANAFRMAWRQIAPDYVNTPEYFTISGSQANIAAIAKFGIKNVLFFDRLYVEAIDGGYRNHEARLPSPYVNCPPQEQPDCIPDLDNIKGIEKAAIEHLKSAIAKKEVKAIFLEPIVGPLGRVRFFRTEFLLELQELCNKNYVAIIADEVLTGGGRTEKFFGFEHYPGFRPDIITFGKGLQVAGVTTTTNKYGYFEAGGTTIQNYAEAILKSTQVLRRIHSGNLMENARTTGAYMLEVLRRKCMRERYLALPEATRIQKCKLEVRGLGLLLYDGQGPAMGRWMPLYTITPDEVDRYFPAALHYRE